MIDVEFTTVVNGDISIEFATKGEGPLIVFVHGWPVSAATFRTLLPHHEGIIAGPL